jgi:release factor glutamine methyltransferase
MMLLDALTIATRTLSAAGVRQPATDARGLAAYAFGDLRADLEALGDADVPDCFWNLIARRAAREPVERITGIAKFGDVELSIGPEVFVPRPETLALVEHAIAWLRRHNRDAPKVADLCTGSGVIALAIANGHQDAEVHAVEIDAAACDRARRNSREHGVRVHHDDAAVALPELNGQVSLVVANPPYIPIGGKIVDPEVRDWDPDPALWAGPDGLTVIRGVERTAARLLLPGGCVIVEHGKSQVNAVEALFRGTQDWEEVSIHPTVDDNFLAATRR